MSRRVRPKSLVLILARDLASRLATPAFLVDAEGTLVYFNEAAEGILGTTYAESREITAREWSTRFHPVDEGGRPVPLRELPLGVALSERKPVHGHLRITAADGVKRSLSVTALPLFAHQDDLEGGLALFWEEPAR